MKENVGKWDSCIRSMVGPALAVAGYLWSKKKRKTGIAMVVAGALITETALTKTCLVNEALGVHTG